METTETQYPKESLLRVPVKLHSRFDDLPVRIKGHDSVLFDSRRKRVAIVGSRTTNLEDISTIYHIVAALAKNPAKPVILSGLAIGTDTDVHRAAIQYKLRTFAVMPCGFDRVYPYTNESLADTMTEFGGGLITFFPDGTAPEPTNFIERTRLLVGMADLVIVICGRINGSAMIAARTAYEYGIPVLAVPGHPGNIAYEGCNQLIKAGIAGIITGSKEFETLNI